jgi:hypothetical protein
MVEGWFHRQVQVRSIGHVSAHSVGLWWACCLLNIGIWGFRHSDGFNASGRIVSNRTKLVFLAITLQRTSCNVPFVTQGILP